MKAFLESALKKLLSHLPSLEKSAKLDNQRVAKRLLRFNAALRELTEQHKGWDVAADSCRRRLRGDMARRVKAAYLDFVEPHL